VESRSGKEGRPRTYSSWHRW